MAVPRLWRKKPNTQHFTALPSSMHPGSKAWIQMRLDKQNRPTEVEVAAESLRQQIAEEESKSIPSPELRELRREYSKLSRYAAVAEEGRKLCQREKNFEAQAWIRAEAEHVARLTILRSFRAWQEKQEQIVWERHREAFDWEFYRKHRWSIGWRGKRKLLGHYVRVKTVGIQSIASVKLAKVIIEFKMLTARFW